MKSHEITITMTCKRCGYTIEFAPNAPKEHVDAMMREHDDAAHPESDLRTRR